MSCVKKNILTGVGIGVGLGVGAFVGGGVREQSWSQERFEVWRAPWVFPMQGVLNIYNNIDFLKSIILKKR